MNEHLSFAHAAFHLGAIVSILVNIFSIMRSSQRTVRPGRTRAPEPDRSLYTWPRWKSDETEPATRHTP
jgi:Uma2 family endonuclease